MPKFQMTLGVRLWSYAREEASHGRVTLSSLAHIHVKHLFVYRIRRLYDHRTVFFLLCLQKAPIDPFRRESCKPSASQGVPLGGMGYDAWADVSVLISLSVFTSWVL